MGVANLGIIGYLSRATFASQLHADFIHLAESRCTYGFAIGETTAVGINGHRAINAGGTIAQ